MSTSTGRGPHDPVKLTKNTGGDDAALWPGRYLTDGLIVIGRQQPARPARTGPSLLQRGGRKWRRLRRRTQWIIAVVVAVMLAAPFRSISDDVYTGLCLGFLAIEGILILASRERPAEVPVPRRPSPEETLAATDSTEARVAGAATRAWAETLREPSWQSPYLAQSRAAFDGQAEVDRIVELALRIHGARLTLGLRPAGPAGEYWARQHEALENAAHQLGRRADALIRHRDQAAALSRELQQLADLERLERSAVAIDDLTVETAVAGPAGEPGLQRLTDDIAGVRAAMSELLDLMTRTRAPLAEAPTLPPLRP